MGQSKALCEWVVEALGHRTDVQTRFVAVRFGNVLNSSGQRDPDLPQADRARRPGDGHPSGDDALLHDDPGGGVARRPGGRDRRTRAGVRARHGRAGADRRPRPEHDPALGQGAAACRASRTATRATSGSSSSAPGPARRSTRSCGARTRPSARPTHPKIMRLSRPPIDPDWLERELADLQRARRRGRHARGRRPARRDRPRAGARAAARAGGRAARGTRSRCPLPTARSIPAD